MSHLFNLRVSVPLWLIRFDDVDFPSASAIMGPFVLSKDFLFRNLLVFAGAGLGGVARYGVGLLLNSSPGLFPWSTFLVNLSGCFAIGVLMDLFKNRGVLTPHHRLFLVMGVLGGYTTFSSFGYETDVLLRAGHPGLALAYALSSVILGLAAVRAGRAAVRPFFRTEAEAAKGAP